MGANAYIEVMIGETPEIDILPPGSTAGAGARRVRAPSWIGRHADDLATARHVAARVALVAPPHARLALAAGVLAIDTAFLIEDTRRGARARAPLAREALGLVAEAGLMLAPGRLAPAWLGRAAPILVAMRRAGGRADPLAR